jgi:tetratricopeptide (TPR) repeat protein
LRRLAIWPALILSGACVYFNAMYNAGAEYDRGVERLRSGRVSEARVAFDSVIHKTERVLQNHPESKYADDAAILKARSELHNELWESAIETAELARQIASDNSTAHLASGLRGVAEFELGFNEAADSLLSVAIDDDVAADDRALFLFYRGQARLALGNPGPAAEDLESASRSIDMSDEARVDLARALMGIGNYDEAIALVANLLRSSRFGDLTQPLRIHLDSLSRKAPIQVDSMVAEQMNEPQTQTTKTSTLYFLRGRAHHYAGDDGVALVFLDSSVAVNPGSRFGAPDAAFLAARLRLGDADELQDVEGTESYLRTATRSSESQTRLEAERLLWWVQRFNRLAEAYQSQGASAAEAVLRAAEIAGVELGASPLARGLYLRYLELTPDSRWAAKAAYGALAYTGHTPADWVEDRGPATDDDLRRLLATLPTEDPYRVAVERTEARTPMSDSLYVRAERDLQERIDAIQMTFDPQAFSRTSPAVAPVAADSAAADSLAPPFKNLE